MKHLFICPLLLFSVFISRGQNIFPSTGSAGIGTTTPATSSLLEVKSITKGVLIPQMTTGQRNAIGSPVQGLLIFQTDGTRGFYYYDGGWKAVAPITSAANTALSNLSATTIVSPGETFI